jgi:hypothetical protein
VKIAINTRTLLAGKLEGIGWFTNELVKRMVLNHPEDEFIFILIDLLISNLFLQKI